MGEFISWNNLTVRPLSDTDRTWVRDLLAEHWGSSQIVSRGRLHDGAALPGFVAWAGGERVGLLTYCFESATVCEVTSLNSLAEGIGAGTALLEAVITMAREAGCVRVWLVTTNDNLHALGFYQRRGFVLKAVHNNALETSRRLKPEIPLIGMNNIPLRDELELEMLL
ncbi:MAG: GNAT family N-acetyltransferase [Anaerolineae bacterium]|nr:GNAT family N-acetyltransferase [Anaerolineae bacterium]